MSAISLRLPEDLESRLDAEVHLTHKPRSELVREALTEYLTTREKERFLADMAASARFLAEDKTSKEEAAAGSEEFSPLDSEALDLADTREAATERSAEKWWR